jgi:hypothetical protein
VNWHDPRDLFGTIDFWAFHIALTVIFIRWLIKAVWHELR